MDYRQRRQGYRSPGRFVSGVFGFARRILLFFLGVGWFLLTVGGSFWAAARLAGGPPSEHSLKWVLIFVPTVFALLCAAAFLSQWLGRRVHEYATAPARKRQAEAEAAAQARLDAARRAEEAQNAARERAEAEARERQKIKDAATRARHDLREATRARVRQAEAQVLQAFAAYRVSVDFMGTMSRADLVHGFARRVAAERPRLALAHLFLSASPDVRAILDAMAALPEAHVHVVPVAFRDGRTFTLAYWSRAEADQTRETWLGYLPSPARSPPAFPDRPREQDWRERCRLRRVWLDEQVRQSFAELTVEFPRPWSATAEQGKAWEEELFRALALALLADPIPDMGLLRESGSLVTSGIVAAAGAAWPPSPVYAPGGRRRLSDGHGLW
jgi:hypothetical protein